MEERWLSVDKIAAFWELRKIRSMLGARKGDCLRINLDGSGNSSEMRLTNGLGQMRLAAKQLSHANISQHDF